MKTITAREANQHFSRLLREAAAGETVIVTSRGRPVAQVTGVGTVTDERVESRKQEFIASLRENGATPIAPWSRDELYDAAP